MHKHGYVSNLSFSVEFITFLCYRNVKVSGRKAKKTKICTSQKNPGQWISVLFCPKKKPMIPDVPHWASLQSRISNLAMKQSYTTQQTTYLWAHVIFVYKACHSFKNKQLQKTAGLSSSRCDHTGKTSTHDVEHWLQHSHSDTPKGAIKSNYNHVTLKVLHGDHNDYGGIICSVPHPADIWWHHNKS